MIATSFKDAQLPGNLPAGLVSSADSSLYLDHIGIAVRSIEAAQGVYQLLGLQMGAVEEIAHEGVRAAMLQLGSTRLELLEPLSPESVIGRFLERRGEGIHHIAIGVDDIDAKFDQCLAAGLRLASDSIRTGAGGHRYFFIHPSSAAGVLLEIVADSIPSVAASDPQGAA